MRLHFQPITFRRCFSSSTTDSPKISWPEFFRLRRRTQLMQRLAGIPVAFGFLMGETAFLSLPLFDPTKQVAGMDPLMAVGLGTIVGLIGSYGLGIGLASVALRYWRPSLQRQLDAKQADFYQRVVRYRANVPPNPTKINFAFDYYGEKVHSIPDYRNWLRRQYQLKRDRL